jgi:hypothetical protein
MVAAESFQRLFDNQEEQRVRRRTLEEAGHFGGNNNSASPSTSPIPSPPVGSALEDPPAPPTMGNPFLCASIPALSALTPRPGSNALTFQQKMSQTGMVCRQRYGPVASKAAERTKAGMTEFAVIASEVYRQECRSDHRGTDDDFFVKEEKDDSVLMEDNSLLSLSEQRDTTSDSKNPSDGKRPMVVTPSTVGSSGSERVTPPPKVDRMGHTNRSFQPSSIYDPEETSDLQAADLSTEHADDPLRGARMELFRNQVSGIDNPEGRLARALEDLNRQDVLIQSLKRQMQMTQTTLDDTTRELEDVKSMAKEKQYKATEIRARAVQEKKRLEDLYENEAMQSKKLRDNVSQLQREVATLKTSLRNARNSQSRSPTQDVNNAQMISMRAELVELRSQLAEAHAINIDDSSARHSSGEVEELKKKLQRDEAEIKELKQKNQEGVRERQGLIQKERQLREKLDDLQTSSKENEEQLKENLQIAIKSADDARAELTKTKANVQRLERERTRAKLHSSADVERAQKDLAKTREELDALKIELSGSRASAKAERKELSKEIETLKEQLRNANQDNLANKTEMMREQRNLQDQVTSHVAEIRDLKEKLTSKDVKLAAMMKQIEDMEQTHRSMKQEKKPTATSRDLNFGETDDNRAFKEATLYKVLLDEARNIPAAAHSHEFLKGIDDDVVKQLKIHAESIEVSSDGQSLETSLRHEISSVKRKLIGSGPKPEAEVRAVALEQTFRNEVAVLKSKLAEAQTKINEEIIRAQEERRVNREDERDRRAEMDRVQKEKDDAIKAKNVIETELAALRKRLSSFTASSAEVPELIPESEGTKSDNTTSMPNNVTRLRSELAQARERLAAARENSRTLPVRPTTSPGPIHEPSAWSSRVMSAADQPKPAALRQAEPMSPQPTKGQPCAQSFMDPSSAPSRNLPSATKVNLQNSPRSVQAKKSFSMEELTKQLELSRKRLQSADKRLNSLVGGGSSITVVRESISDSSFDGSIDEVVTGDGSIEVSHRRFADI